jgi:hypothetical protein
MFIGLCDGSNTLIESKLHEAFTIICIRLPQDFLMDFQAGVCQKAAQEMGVGPSGPAHRIRFEDPWSKLQGIFDRKEVCRFQIRLLPAQRVD